MSQGSDMRHIVLDIYAKTSKLIRFEGSVTRIFQFELVYDLFIYKESKQIR